MHGEAITVIEKGYATCGPDDLILLTGSDVYRASGDRDKSLEYAKLLIEHHSSNWNGYARAAQDLVFLQQFDEAQSYIIEGLQRLPNQLNLLVTASDVYRASGDRNKSLEYAKLLIEHHSSNWNGYARALPSLIILDRENEAAALLSKAKSLYNNKDQPELLSKLDRYLNSGLLKQEAERCIYDTRERLHSLFSKAPSCLPALEILNHSDYILLANNSTLEFDEADCNLIRKMPSPLFVYSNIGNPTFCNSRDLFWHEGCSELLYGRTQHVASTEGRLVFRPFDPNRFLGCFFIKEGNPDWLSRFSSINSPLQAFVADEINKTIRDCYPESYFVERSSRAKRLRAPSMGWYAVSLFEALSTFASTPRGIELGSTGSQPRVWTAGFTLSPSYIFEVVASELHDHTFEKAALNYRSENGLTRSIGYTNCLAKELGQPELLPGVKLWSNK
jgi:tetratricopeptide (TPR) repeat protein